MYILQWSCWGFWMHLSLWLLLVTPSCDQCKHYTTWQKGTIKMHFSWWCKYVVVCSKESNSAESGQTSFYCSNQFVIEWLLYVRSSSINCQKQPKLSFFLFFFLWTLAVCRIQCYVASQIKIRFFVPDARVVSLFPQSSGKEEELLDNAF